MASIILVIFTCFLHSDVNAQNTGGLNPPNQALRYPSILFLVDLSGSMDHEVDGQRKIDVARRIIANIVSHLSTDVGVGFATFGGGCNDAGVILPIGASSDVFVNQLYSVIPKGETPLAYGIQMAANYICGLEKKVTLVVITDGVESCGGDPCAASYLASKAGVMTKIHVVGFGLGATGSEQLQCVADEGGGSYYSAKDAVDLKTALDEVVEDTRQEWLQNLLDYEYGGFTERIKEEKQKTNEALIRENTLKIPVLIREMSVHLGEKVKKVYIRRDPRRWREVDIRARVIVTPEQTYWGAALPHEEDIRIGGINTFTGEVYSSEEMDARGGIVVSEGLGPIDYAIDVIAVGAILKSLGKKLFKQTTKQISKKCEDLIKKFNNPMSLKRGGRLEKPNQIRPNDTSGRELKPKGTENKTEDVISDLWKPQPNKGVSTAGNASKSGAQRAARNSGNWKDVSLNATVKRIAGDNPIIDNTPTGKTIFRNPSTGVEVVYDTAGNYFRVSKGKHYFDEFGKPIPDNVPLTKFNKTTQTGVPRDVREALTHFNNSD